MGTAENEADGSERQGADASAEIVVNARFRPNGLVESITYKPAELSPQEWFDKLSASVPQAYCPLAGGRGAFKIPIDVLERIRGEAVTG